MPAKTLMIQGTSSSAGKSLLVTALCHYYARKGIRTAPFKAQNMSNNAAVCPDGAEIGRAQAVQAAAAGLEPTADMNPILIKPEADSRSQIIVMGTPWDTLPAREYYPQKSYLWEKVTSSLDRLRNEYDLVLIEGAGSPAELNLKDGDIVNMAVARYANAPVLLVGDIDRGGIFAQLLGTYWLLPPEEQTLMKGFIVNKFRGDISLFEDGIRILEEKSDLPVMGVFPYLYNLHIPEEDAVALEAPEPVLPRTEDIQVDIAVIRLPRISNFDDFDPLVAEPGVRVRYVTQPEQLKGAQAVIIPGTKSTARDLEWIRKQGLSRSLKALADQGGSVVGICGGYQMLGKEILDPGAIESDRTQIQGLNLLPITTTFLDHKSTYQVRAQVEHPTGWLKDVGDAPLEGYEIHMGQTRGDRSWLRIQERNDQPVQIPDGSLSPDGRIWGCYIHGVFANHNLRQAWLKSLGWKPPTNSPPDQDPFAASLTYLADTLESTLDMNRLENILWDN
jgi:adenosylcobyric acid synthase